MSRIKEFVEKGYTVLFYEEDTIKDREYLFTLRQTQDGEFISDKSILDIWQDSLDEISWVDSNTDFKYALEVYYKKNGYFTSLAPVILCDTKEASCFKEDELNLEKIEKLFKDLKKPIEKQVDKLNEFTKEFGKALESNGFKKQFIGGGYSVRI